MRHFTRSIFVAGAVAGCGGLSASVGSTSSGSLTPSGDDSGGGTAPDPFAYVAGVRHPLPEVYVINMQPNPKPYSPEDLHAQCPQTVGFSNPDPDSMPVPDLADKTADEAVAILTKLGRYCVTVHENTDCTAASGDLHICEQRPAAGETVRTSEVLAVQVQSDIMDRGTDHETRRVPELDGRHRDDVLADLARRGFTNVQVVDEDAGCEPDTVCYPDVREGSFLGAGEAIVLHIRRPRRSR